MGKNKKNKYFGNKKSYSEHSSKKGKKNKSKNKDYYKSPKLKTVHPSLDKHDSKDMYKIVTRPVEVDEKFVKGRTKCNHAGDLIAPSKFRAMTASYGAYTPMLDIACRIFGEDNVSVCGQCYDVLIKPSMVGTAELEQASAMMYLAANVVLSRYRMKKDEIKKISKLRDALSDWDRVIARLDKLEQAGALDESAVSDNTQLSEKQLAELNKRGVI